VSARHKHSVRVNILGEEYSIRSEVSPERTRAVAEHYDGLVRRLLASGTVIETHRAAILAALQVTSELLEAREVAREVTDGMRGLSEELRRLLPPAKRGDRPEGAGEPAQAPGSAE